MSPTFACEKAGALYLVVRVLEGVEGAHEYMHLDGPYPGRIAQTPILMAEARWERWLRNYEIVK